MKKRELNFLEVKGLIDIEAIAASLAAASDEEQSYFFNTFFKALKADCGDEYRYLCQMSFISSKLDDKTKESFKHIGE